MTVKGVNYIIRAHENKVKNSKIRMGKNMKSVIIGIAGGTGSGKSTFTNRLRDEFKDNVAVIYQSFIMIIIIVTKVIYL